MAISAVYALLYCAHIFATAPATIRADYLYHLTKLVEWDRRGDYGDMLRFVFEFQSGHLIAIQKIIAIANFYFFESSVLFSRLVGLIVLLGYWAMHVSRLGRERDLPAALGVAGFTVLMFSPHGYEVYTWSDAIPAHYITAVCALWCLTVTHRMHLEGFSARAGGAFVAALALAILSNGTGWALVPVLSVWSILSARRVLRRRYGNAGGILWVLLSAGLVALVWTCALWALSHANAGQPIKGLDGYRLALEDPFGVFRHLLSLMVSPWAQFDIALAWKLGFIPALAFCWLAYRTCRTPDTDLSLWLAYTAFGIVSCALVAYTRFDRDVYQFGAVSSRYSVYALPIYAGLIGGALSVDRAVRRAREHSPARHLRAWLCATAALPLLALFAWSWKAVYPKEVYQNREITLSHRGTINWNMKSAFRLSSVYELPWLYLDTLPQLKAAGRARVLTDPFIPAGDVDAQTRRALDDVIRGRVEDLTRSARCAARGDARVVDAMIDERFLPRIRRHGTPFLRTIGSFRDPEACDDFLHRVMVVAHGNVPLCTGRTNVFLWEDLPPRDQLRGVTDTPYAFDVSCPFFGLEPAIYPVKVYGISSRTQKVYLIGTIEPPVPILED